MLCVVCAVSIQNERTISVAFHGHTRLTDALKALSGGQRMRGNSLGGYLKDLLRRGRAARNAEQCRHQPCAARELKGRPYPGVSGGRVLSVAGAVGPPRPGWRGFVWRGLGGCLG